MAHDDHFTATGPAFTGSGQAYSKRCKPASVFQGSYRPVDDFVAALVIAQLFQQDAADLLLIDDGRNLEPSARKHRRFGRDWGSWPTSSPMESSLVRCWPDFVGPCGPPCPVPGSVEARN
jgi:hypothetical protein